MSAFRTTALGLKVILRTLSIIPPSALAGWCLLALVQEPNFFRYQQLDLAWPAIYASADLLCLAITLCWCLTDRQPSPNRFFVLPQLYWGQVMAVLLACVCAQLLAPVIGVLGDQVLAAPTPWASLPDHALRAILVWAPLSMLAVGAKATIPFALQPPILILAFVAMLGMHPVSLLPQTASLDKLFGSALSIVGSYSIARLGKPAVDITD